MRASDVDPKGKCDISEDGGLALGHETEGGRGFTQEVESVVEGLLLTQVTGSTYFHTYLLGRYVWNPMRFGASTAKQFLEILSETKLFQSPQCAIAIYRPGPFETMG